jgi:PAS domain S-box-containing protein
MSQSESHLSVQAQYQILVSSMEDCAIYMLSPTGIVTGWNPSARRLMGYDGSKILGKQFSCFYRNEDRLNSFPDKALETSVSSGIFQGREWCVRSGGDQFRAYVVIKPVLSLSGALAGFSVVTRALSEREVEEGSATEREGQLWSLLQGIPDYGILMLDQTGSITVRNEQALKLYSSKEIIGEHFSRFFTEEDRRRGEPQSILDAAVRERRLESEGWRVREDGSRFWADVITGPIWSKQGDLSGFAEVTRDTTNRREAQSVLDHSRSALAQSQKMDAMGRLSGGVAHDFNNILQSIISGLEVVLGEVGDETAAHEFAAVAIKSARRGAALTRHLLSYTHQRVLRPEPVIIASVFAELQKLFARTLGSQIATRMRAGRRICALADLGQLHTALVNLASNAAHAMPGGGALRMDASVERDVGQDWVLITVRDAGIGMDEATLAQAAEPFFTTRGTEGNGLGLSMVKGFVEQSGGRFTVTSNVGQGTTVELRLPSVDLTKLAERQEPVEMPIDLGRLLIVDDAKDVLAPTCAFLTKAGFSVVQVDSGDKALVLLAAGEQFDAIISDYAMPGMNGAALIAEALVARPELKALLITGYAGINYADTLPKGTLVLHKPFRRDALLEALQRIMNGTRI